MSTSNRTNLVGAFAAGIALAGTAAVLMGQAASQPVKSDLQYFVTGEGDNAHLWVREGAKLRCVGHGECTEHKHDHKGGDKHDHGKEAPKK